VILPLPQKRQRIWWNKYCSFPVVFFISWAISPFRKRCGPDMTVLLTNGRMFFLFSLCHYISGDAQVFGNYSISKNKKMAVYTFEFVWVISHVSKIFIFCKIPSIIHLYDYAVPISFHANILANHHLTISCPLTFQVCFNLHVCVRCLRHSLREVGRGEVVLFIVQFSRVWVLRPAGQTP